MVPVLLVNRDCAVWYVPPYDHVDLTSKFLFCCETHRGLSALSDPLACLCCCSSSTYSFSNSSPYPFQLKLNYAVDMDAAQEESGNVILVSKEGESFTVPIAVAKMSKLVEITIDGESDDETQEIPLPNVKASILGKVIEYCTHYITVEPMTPITTPLKSPKIEEVVQQWYADFVKVDQTILFELVTSANFMDIKPLLDLTCFAVAVFIKGKSADEIRKIFNISNDFTPDEEAQVREENKWCEN